MTSIAKISLATLCCSLLWALLLLTGCGEDAPKALRMGEVAPAFAAKDLQGRPVALTDYRNRPVVIRFFLPDCKFCRVDTAVFNDYYQVYKQRGLGVIYVDTEPKPKPGEIQKFVDELKIVFPVVIDGDRTIANQYRVQVVPQTVVLDPKHQVVGAILGGVSKEELDSLLLPFLK